MEVVWARCAGLDGHQKTVMARVLVRQGRDRLRAVETFGTTTPALLDLQTWLTEHWVTHVAMESTGSYWKPVFNLLESSFTTWLVNPAHTLAVDIWYLLTRHTPYADLGVDYFDRRD